MPHPLRPVDDGLIDDLVNRGNNRQDVFWKDADYQAFLDAFGDLNGDYAVTAADLTILADNAGMTGATWEDGDLDAAGEVTMDDLDLALAQYGLSGLLLSVAG